MLGLWPRSLIGIEQRGGLRVALLFFLLSRDAAEAMVDVGHVAAGDLTSHDLCVSSGLTEVSGAVFVMNRQRLCGAALDAAERPRSALNETEPRASCFVKPMEAPQQQRLPLQRTAPQVAVCLLYTSDAADE